MTASTMHSSGASPEAFAVRLERAVADRSSCLVAGIDPVVERLPREILGAVGAYRPMDSSKDHPLHPARAAAALALFSREVIAQVAPYVCAVKPNAAFFERFGPAGLDALQQTCRAARKEGLLVILDAKRGDLTSTADAYAEGWLGSVPDTPGEAADALTVNPYFGIDGVRPFVEVAAREGKGLFVLVRTSNPSAAQFQELECDGEPVYLHVARRLAEWAQELDAGTGLSLVGAVVGATAPGQAETVRGILERSTFLVPGFGAQGAGAGAVRPHFLPGGRGAVVNASRSILYAFEKTPQTPWREAVALAAKQARDELEAVRRDT